MSIKKGRIIAKEKRLFVKKLAADYKRGKLDNQIVTTKSGLKYVIHENGSGDNPSKGTKVFVHYLGALTNGNEFDNSFERGKPFKFSLGVGSVIQGWDEGIALLNIGSKATFFIPSELGYGKQGSPPVIPRDSELIFYVELIDF